MAMKREKSLSQGEKIDQYMPTDSVLRTMQSIDDQKTREINAISSSDPDRSKKVKEIEARAK